MIEYQNILISPDVFNYIRNSYSDPDGEDIDLRSYKQNLQLKCLVLDTRTDDDGVYSKIKKIIQDSTDLAKNKLQVILDEFLESKRVRFENPVTEKIFADNTEHNYLFNLALTSETKIINSQLDILLYKNRISEFEIYNIEDVINPPQNSSIFSISRDIERHKGEELNIFEVLRYYWINTTSLIIEDDYLRKLDNPYYNSDGQFSKLIELIKACKNLSHLIIRTSFSDIRQSSEEYLSRTDFEREIIEQTGIHPQIEDIKVGERHYYTDYFKIHLGKGLDFFNIKKGYKVYRPKVTIRITPLENTEIS